MTEAEHRPAGTPDEDRGPGFAERGRIRRRLRFLRRARELALRDLGGLVYDLRRFGRDGDDLIEAKVVSLQHTDDELHALEQGLALDRYVFELREAGISACPSCETIVSSEAKFCSNCGKAL